MPVIPGISRHIEILSRGGGSAAGPRRAISMHRDEIILNMATLCFFLTIHSVAPYLPQYAVDIGAAETDIALLGPFFALSAILFRPLSGVLADRGWTKVLLAAGATISATAQIIYFISPGIGFLYAGRLVQGTAIALFIPASFQAAAIGSKEVVISAIAWRSTIVGLSLAMGPALGGYIALRFGYRALFVFSTILALLASILSLKIDGTRSSHAEKSPDSGENGPKILNRGFTTALASLLLYSSAYASIALFLPAYHKEAGLGVTTIAIFFTGTALSSLISRIMFTYILRAISVEKTAMLGILLLSAGYILVSIDPLSHNIIYYGIVAGIGSGIAIPSLQVIAITGVPQRKRGIASAIYTLMFDLGNLSGPALAAAIARTYRGMIEVSSYLSLAALIPITSLQIPRLLRDHRKA